MGIILFSTGSISLVRADSELDGNKIGQAAGMKAATTKDGVVRLSWPRTDVPVHVDGMALQPFAGLGAWAASSTSAPGADARDRVNTTLIRPFRFDAKLG